MRWRNAAVLLFLTSTLIGGLSGCAGQQLSLSQMLSRDSVDTVSTQPAPRDVALSSDSEQASKNDSPFFDPPSESSASRDGTHGKIIQTSGTQETAASQNQSRVASALKSRLDAETLLMIEEEFRDADPEDRLGWYNILLNVEPAMVPQILAAHRASRSRDATERKTTVAQRQPSPDEFISYPPAGPPADPVITPAGTTQTFAPHPPCANGHARGIRRP